MFGELHELNVEALNEQEAQSQSRQHGTPPQDHQDIQNDPPVVRESAGPMTHARSTLKSKAKSVKDKVVEQRKAAEATEIKRKKKFQSEWETAKSNTSRQQLKYLFDEDPGWSGATSLYSSVTQIVEKGITEQVMTCRIGGPGQLRAILE